VEVTDKTGAVPPARATLPPLVTVTVRVVVEVIRPVVIEPVAEGAERVKVELVAIVPVEMEPAVAVIAREELLVLIVPVVTELELIEAVLPVLSAAVVTVPFAAVTVSVFDWMVPVAVIEPVVAVSVSAEVVVTAPSVILPADEVTVVPAEPPFVSVPETPMSPATVMVPVLLRTLVAVSFPEAEVAEMVRVEEVEMFAAVI
jgi:hypothetical protein